MTNKHSYQYTTRSSSVLNIHPLSKKLIGLITLDLHRVRSRPSTSNIMSPILSPAIKHVHMCGNQSLFTDQFRCLWIMGANSNGCLGVSTTDINCPVRTEIRLEPNEYVTEFYQWDRLTVIYTNCKRLFISRVIYNAACKENLIVEADGTYPAVPRPSNQTLSWPESLSTTFSMPYAPHIPTPANTSIEPAASNVPLPSPAHRPWPTVEPSDLLAYHTTPLEPLHDFGTNYGHDNSKFQSSCSSTCSVHFASEPGFAPPLLDIDEVTFIGSTIFFRCGLNHYVYDWRLTIGASIWNNLGLALTPVQHQRVLTYYQLHLPFSLDTFKYCNNFTYMKSGSVHHVLSADIREDAELPLSWRYFELEGLDPNHIHVDNPYPELLVLHNNIMYLHLAITNTLRPVIDLGTRIYTFYRSMHDQGFACVSKRGYVIEYPSVVHCLENDLTDSIVNACVSIPKDAGMLIIDHDSTESYMVRADALFINIRGAIKYQLTKDGVLIYKADRHLELCVINSVLDQPHLKLIHKFSIRDHTYRVYEWVGEFSQPDSIQTSEDMALLEHDSQYRKYLLAPHKDAKAITDITLSSPSTIISVHPIFAAHPVIKYSPIPIAVSIASCADRLERLSAIAEMFSVGTKLSITYICKTRVISHGQGVLRVLVQDAVSQFASIYLTKHRASTSFKVEAFEGISAHKLYILGRMLHMAIIVTKSFLPIRLPLALMVALKKREPTVPELEYVARKESPEAFDRLQAYRNDPDELAACGYDSYRESLCVLTHYDTNRPEVNERTLVLSELLAEGFLSYTPITHLVAANIPTIDYYISGPYSIDRTLLKDRLTGSNPIKQFMTEIITALPEEQLAILLRNWAGTAVLIDSPYTLKECNSEIFFQTCTLTLEMPLKFCTNESIDIPRTTVIEILTTPIDHIRD